MEAALARVVEDQNAQEVRGILQKHPGLDVNWKNQKGWTSLHFACTSLSEDIVALLLANVKIDVNVPDADLRTPLWWACYRGQLGSVRPLLKHPGILMNKADRWGFTPLRWAAHYGHLAIIQWMVASDTDLQLGEPGNNFSDSVGSAKRMKGTDVVLLLESYAKNPVEVRHAVRIQIGYYEERAAEVFALVVFLCDSLLACQEPGSPENEAARRFFWVIARLPMDLQIVLARRTAGSMKNNIAQRDREAAFRELASCQSL